eukprot:tig00000769_g4005.t1
MDGPAGEEPAPSAEPTTVSKKRAHSESDETCGAPHGDSPHRAEDPEKRHKTADPSSEAGPACEAETSSAGPAPLLGPEGTAEAGSDSATAATDLNVAPPTPPLPTEESVDDGHNAASVAGPRAAAAATKQTSGVPSFQDMLESVCALHSALGTVLAKLSSGAQGTSAPFPSSAALPAPILPSISSVAPQAVAGTAWANLIPQYGSQPLVPISGPCFNIGRNSRCMFQLRDPAISGMMCRIVSSTQHPGQASLENLSSNGSLTINGKFLRKGTRQTLKSGDEITITGSKTYSFIFQQLSAPPAPITIPSPPSTMHPPARPGAAASAIPSSAASSSSGPQQPFPSALAASSAAAPAAGGSARPAVTLAAITGGFTTWLASGASSFPAPPQPSSAQTALSSGIPALAAALPSLAGHPPRPIEPPAPAPAPPTEPTAGTAGAASEESAGESSLPPGSGAPFLKGHSLAELLARSASDEPPAAAGEAGAAEAAAGAAGGMDLDMLGEPAPIHATTLVVPVPSSPFTRGASGASSPGGEPKILIPRLHKRLERQLQAARGHGQGPPPGAPLPQVSVSAEASAEAAAAAAAATAAVICGSAQKAAVREELLRRVLRPAELEKGPTFAGFPYFLSEDTRELLVGSVYTYLRRPELARHTAELPPMSRRLLLSGPQGTEIYQESLVRALAHHLGVSLLILDPPESFGDVFAADGPAPAPAPADGTSPDAVAPAPAPPAPSAASALLQSLRHVAGFVGPAHAGLLLGGSGLPGGGERPPRSTSTSPPTAASSSPATTPRGPPIGHRGKVVITFDDNPRKVGVRFDKALPGGNNLGHLCEDGHGFFCNASELRLESEDGREQLVIEAAFEVAASEGVAPCIVYVPDVDRALVASYERYALFKRELERVSGAVVVIGSSTAEPRKERAGGGALLFKGGGGGSSGGASLLDFSFLDHVASRVDEARGAARDGPAKSSKMAARLFPAKISLGGPSEEPQAARWRRQIERDVEYMRAEANRIALGRCLERAGVVLAGPLDPALLKAEALSQETVEKAVGLAVARHLMRERERPAPHDPAACPSASPAPLAPSPSPSPSPPTDRPADPSAPSPAPAPPAPAQPSESPATAEASSAPAPASSAPAPSAEAAPASAAAQATDAAAAAPAEAMDVEKPAAAASDPTPPAPAEAAAAAEAATAAFAAAEPAAPAVEAAAAAPAPAEAKEARKEALPKLTIAAEDVHAALALLERVSSDANPQSKALREVVAENEFEKRLLGEVIPPWEIGVRFDDIGALDTVKEALKETVMLPLQRPELFRKGNLTKPCKGILLFGPPGTGKTMLAKAVATEAGANFINVTMSTIASKWFGEGEKYVKALFTLASKIAPTVVFVDEVDSMLGKREKQGEHEAMRKIKNEFMSLWDGLKTKENERVLVLAASNRPFDLDDAVLRRFRRRFLVDLPDAENRAKILRVILAGEDLGPDVDVEALAAATEGYSGSDLKNVCVAAAHQPIREVLQREREAGGAPQRPAKRASGHRHSAMPGEGGEEEEEEGVAMRALGMRDFEKAREEIGASVSEDAFSIGELRKWNEMYGEGGSRRKEPLTYFM